MNLSEHFTLAEFTRSDTAMRLKIDNTPSAEHLTNLTRLAAALEDVRALLGHPIIITSGYRSPALNRAVDGVSNSSHCLGQAADFHCPGFGDDMTVCRMISASRLKFDQLIFEQARSSWVHLGIGDQMRRDVISWRSGRGYRAGIVRIE
ncbi:D-Ala-D-Ala carboxypeptidase family metallohydrolase [Paralcaligenes ginsengisoli]